MAATIRVVNTNSKAQDMGNLPADGAVSLMKLTDTALATLLVVDHGDGFSFQAYDPVTFLPIQLRDVMTVTGVASADPTVAQVLNVNATRIRLALLKNGATSITGILTYKQGGQGPFSFAIPLAVFGNPATGLKYGFSSFPAAV